MEARKLLTKQFIKKTALKLIVFIIAMIVVTAVSQALTPVISNDIYMGQMENSDDLYVMMEMYNKIKPIFDLIYVVVVVWFAGAIVRDTSKFIKAVKSDNTETN